MDPDYEERRRPLSMTDFLGLRTGEIHDPDNYNMTFPPSSPSLPSEIKYPRSSVVYMGGVSKVEYEEARVPLSMEDMLGLKVESPLGSPSRPVSVVGVGRFGSSAHGRAGRGGVGGDIEPISRSISFATSSDALEARRRSISFASGGGGRRSSVESRRRSVSFAAEGDGTTDGSTSSRRRSVSFATEDDGVQEPARRSRPRSVSFADDAPPLPTSSAATGEIPMLSIRALREASTKRRRYSSFVDSDHHSRYRASNTSTDTSGSDSDSSDSDSDGDGQRNSRVIVPPQRVRYRSLLDGPQTQTTTNTTRSRPISIAGYEVLTRNGRMGELQTWRSENIEDGLPTYEQAISDCDGSAGGVTTATTTSPSAPPSASSRYAHLRATNSHIVNSSGSQPQHQRSIPSNSITSAPPPSPSRLQQQDVTSPSLSTRTHPQPSSSSSSLFTRLLRRRKSADCYTRPPPPQEGVPVEYDRFGNRKMPKPAPMQRDPAAAAVKPAKKRRWSSLFPGSMGPPRQMFGMNRARLVSEGLDPW
ncbi:hypothetical protein DFH27DRAFT_34419 [Peziza echinospora]|nr:hypothetical protein DFH27DRAFT_34419 [Peziza echinospora]